MNKLLTTMMGGLALFASSVWAITPDEIRARGTVKIGIYDESPGIAYIDSNGKNQGFDIELAKALGKKLMGDESKIEFVVVRGTERIVKLKTREIDLVVANLTVTPSREKEVTFSDAYMMVHPGIISPSSAPIKSLTDLAGKKLAVIKSSAAENLFRDNAEVTLVKCSPDECFNLLKNKEVDAMVDDNAILFAWAFENSGFEVGIPTASKEADSIAVAIEKSDTELAQWINTELQAMKADGRMAEIYNQTLAKMFGNKINMNEFLNIK